MTNEEMAKRLREASRRLHRITGKAGKHSTKKGKKGYSRKAKHAKRGEN